MSGWYFIKAENHLSDIKTTLTLLYSETIPSQILNNLIPVTTILSLKELISIARSEFRAFLS